jgi:hypothetical protein
MANARATDTISAKEGVAYITIDGIMHEAFYARNIEAKVEKQKVELHLLGHRMTKHKTVGMTGSGTFTIYYMSPYYRQMVEKYKDTGEETYFEMTLKNEDPESTVGANVQTLHDVSVDSVTLAKFDMEGEVLDEEVPFTFDDYTGLAQFAEEPQH